MQTHTRFLITIGRAAQGKPVRFGFKIGLAIGLPLALLLAAALPWQCSFAENDCADRVND